MPNIAYVAKSDETIAVVNVDTNVVLSTIPIGFVTNWIALTSDAKKAYLANQFNNTINVLDLTSETIVAVIPLGSFNNQANQPKQIFVHPNGLAYSANVSGTVSIIDTTSDTLITTVPVGQGISDMELSPDGNYFYIVHDLAVSQFSTITNGVTNTILISNIAGDLTVSPDGQFVYVAIPGNIFFPNNLVVVVDIALSMQTATVTVGNRPEKIDINSIGSRVYVANAGSGDVSVIDVPTNTVIATIPVGTTPNFQVITPDFGSQDYVARSGGITAINSTTFTPSPVVINATPIRMVITPDGSKLIATAASTFLAIVNTQTNTLITEVELGASSGFIALAPQVSQTQELVYTTGIVMNLEDGLSLAQTVSVNVLNESYLRDVIVEVLAFAIPTLGSKTPIGHHLFLVPSDAADMKAVDVSGVANYEIQVKISGLDLANVVLSIYGLNAMGNVISDQIEQQGVLIAMPGLSFAP
ncbi:beta-propeller fold lactonase family protein [Paenibacillus sp. MWE-103]|uniref:Beta-propeller fold lactonase family protein n=1 Tax=Paenibacillus artemisiicola TaxID=1172618 RepID=A0ABS3WBS5_9BACL|nr:beta-propeller fold lactonase family protein [Paenibacillus artemisiicola]MBO7745775.1 beta-propeller fold lactonase family protein [Paenibacillus artemisiicola]